MVDGWDGRPVPYGFLIIAEGDTAIQHFAFIIAAGSHYRAGEGDGFAQNAQVIHFFAP